MKDSSDTIGNRTRYLPACSTVPQTSAQPRDPQAKVTQISMTLDDKDFEGIFPGLILKLCGATTAVLLQLLSKPAVA
jgi:hypothetical protein